MSKKSGNFFERHIDKVVLGAAGVICIWLLITHVLLSSSYVKYGSEKVGPGEVDMQVSTQADRLEARVQEKPIHTKPPVDSGQADKFKELIASGIDIDVSLGYPIPSRSSRFARGDRKYIIPEIGEVSEVAAALVSGVGQVPVEEVGQSSEYYTMQTKIDDLDLVTVEGMFDAAGLYERFYRSFASEDDAESNYTKPVFAAVQLQRQRMKGDGSWPGDDEWEQAPRTKIDQLSEMFSIPEKVNELSSDKTVEILMIQFDQPNVTVGLLQPEPYSFNTPSESWLSPSLEVERKKRLEKEKAEEERKRKEETRKAEEERKKQERERRGASAARTGGGARGSRQIGGASRGSGLLRGTGTRGTGTRTRRSGTTSTRTRRGSQSSSQLLGPGGRMRRLGLGMPGGMMRPGLQNLLGGYGARRTTTVGSGPEGQKFAKEVQITENTDIASLQKLVFWAHDDTAEPGGTYRYRIRIGVFNPIAGTEQFSEQNEAFKEMIVLWSAFSAVTEAIEIPGRLYFFPQRVALETDKSVSVKVSKKLLGKWYSEDFIARPGELIGGVKALPATATGTMMTGMMSPESIDYNTGVILVDVVDDVRMWGGVGVLGPRHYSDMLYTRDGVSIKHLPIKESYWPDELREQFNDIKELQEKEKKSLLPGMADVSDMPGASRRTRRLNTGRY